MGVEQSIGEIVLFLDDDVVLHRDFILELMNTYRARNEAKGVQGWWLHSFMPGLSFLAQNAFYKAFWLFSYSSGTCDVLHDFAQTYPLRLSRDTKCQWMSGCNQSYRRSILVEFKFDENLRSYAFGEDLDLSLRVTRKYPGSLIITPRAKLRHLAWNAPPNLSREKMLMHFVYPRYLLYKLAPDNAKTYFLFAWSELGRLLLLGFMIGGDRVTNLRNAIDSFKLCRRHLKELREQRIDFFDTWFEPERATRSNRWGVDASRR